MKKPSNEYDELLEEVRDLKTLLAEANRKLRAIFNLVEGDADGTIDATDHEKFCNRIAGLTGISL